MGMEQEKARQKARADSLKIKLDEAEAQKKKLSQQLQTLLDDEGKMNKLETDLQKEKENVKDLEDQVRRHRELAQEAQKKFMEVKRDQQVIEDENRELRLREQQYGKGGDGSRGRKDFV